MFDNDKLGDRQELIRALNEVGLEAREFVTDDGKKKVIVPLLDMGYTTPIVAAENPELRTYLVQAAKSWSHQTYLYISTQRLAGETQVGVLGDHAEIGEKFSSKIWKSVSSVETAVAAFQDLWEQRDTWLNNFMTQVGKSEA